MDLMSIILSEIKFLAIFTVLLICKNIHMLQVLA